MKTEFIDYIIINYFRITGFIVNSLLLKYHGIEKTLNYPANIFSQYIQIVAFVIQSTWFLSINC